MVLWSVESRSRGSLVHTVSLTRSEGYKLRCSCEDAVYRKKRGSAADTHQGRCFHQQIVLKILLSSLQTRETL